MSGERPEDLAKAGVEHLQAAAREMIQAGRSLLDALEELVEDPATVQSLVGSISSLAQGLAARLRHHGEPGDGDDDEGRVQRIHVS